MAEQSLPIDRGWSWIVLAGTFIVNMLVMGCFKSFGLLYAEFLDYFQTGAGETAWIFSVTVFILSICGSLSSALGKRIGFRFVAMIGSVVTCLGYVTSALVPNMRLLYLTYGVIVGFGVGMTFTPTIVMVTMYFNKRRSLANGVTVAGSSVGYFLYPLLTRYLIKTYTLYGTMIILGGIILNSCVGAALLRPLESFRKRKGVIRVVTERDEEDKARKDHHNNSGEEVSKRASCCRISPKTSCNIYTVYDCSHLCNPVFLLYVTAFSLATMSFSSAFIVVPPHAEDCDVSKDNVALLVSLAGLSDLAGRIFFGWFSDLKFVRRKFVFVVAMLAGGISALLAPLATSFIPLAIYTCWYGLFGGCYWALIAVLLADSFGVEKIPELFGLAITLTSVPNLLSPPILGWVRDATGSWNLSFWLAGIWMILAGIAILLEPLVTRLIRKTEVTSEKRDSTSLTF